MKKITYLIAILVAITTNIAFANDVEDVLVTSSILGLKTSEIENPLHIISEEDINKFGTRNIGESLDNLIGVAAIDFGTMVGQPVIRGLSGPRNSDAKTAAFKTGLSIVEDWGYVGLSFKNIENVYGIPFHGEHDEAEIQQYGEERIETSTDSDTFNIKGSYEISRNLFKQVDYFYSDTDYSLIEAHIGGKHNGEKTTFANDAKEFGANFDLSINDLTQKVVVKSMDEDTSILGEEAFMENVQSEEKSIGYYLGSKISDVHVDFGLRRDEVNRKSKFNSTAHNKD